MAAIIEPISKTKIILPRRRQELLTRTRLLDILYDRLDRKLIIISAAAGYGKTSLLIDLAHHSELPFCWLGLDPLDSDPQRFVAGLIASLGEKFKGFGNRSRSMLNGITNLEEGMERVLVTLVNEIYDDIHEHFVLVLDDFHVLDEARPILYFVNRFIQLVGENCHIVLASRTLPPLQDIPLWVAREDVGGLDYSDLAFHPDELQSLLAQNRHIQLSDEDARRLVDATEGWITGLQFADLGELTAKIGTQPSRTPRRVGITVFDYLGQQVLEQQPKELQTFMLRTALLEEFDAQMCEAVLGPLYTTPPAWSRLLETITQKNLFAQSVGANGQWLRYHHLFRDYLHDRFRKECPEEVEPILWRTAQYQEQAGEWEKAYQIYTRLDNAEAVAGLVERAGIPMYQHAALTLESWLKALPPSTVNSRPGLLSLRGNIELLKGNGEEALRLQNRAIRIYREQLPAEGLALAMVRRGSTYQILGRYEQALEDAEEVLNGSEPSEDKHWIQGDALRIHGLCLYRLGRSQEAIQYLEQALDVYVRSKDSASIPLLLMETGLAYSVLGNYKQAKLSYEKARKMWREAGNLSQESALLNNYGVLHQSLGEYEEAAHALEEGLLCAQQSGYRHMEAVIALSLGDLYSEVEDFELATQNYNQANELNVQLGESFIRNYLSLAMANMALVKRDLHAARPLIEEASDIIRDSRSSFENGFMQLLKGRFELQSGRPAAALPPLREAKRLFVEGGREAETTWASIWLAATEYESGDFAEARDEIRGAVPKVNDVPHSAIIAARQATDWLERLRKDPDIRSQLRGLFDKVERLDDRLPPTRRQLRRLAHTIEVPTPTLIIRGFGAGQVWVDGNMISAKEWQTQSVRELFFYFLAAGRPLTREQVGVQLWPEREDPARFRIRFKNEIYRLRRVVGQDTILFDGDTYRFDPLADHEYDVEAFKAYLKKASSAGRSEEKMHFYERAVELVKGRYLEGVSAVWVMAEQEHLHRAYMAAVQNLAEIYQKESLTTKLIDLCQRALGLDKTAEVLYRLLMQAYARLGDKASVVRTYQMCEKNLEERLQVPPSAETKELYEQLIT